MMAALYDRRTTLAGPYHGARSLRGCGSITDEL